MSNKYNKWSIGDLNAEQYRIRDRLAEIYSIRAELNKEWTDLEEELDNIGREIDKNRIMNNNRRVQIRW